MDGREVGGILPRLLRNWRKRGRGMRISTRLLLIIAVCILPMLVLQVASALRQREERKAQLDDLVAYQAGLLAGDVESIVGGARLLLTAASDFNQIRTNGPHCSERLTTLQRQAPRFAFLLRLDETGRIRCASDLALLTAADAPWLAPPGGTARFETGRYTRAPSHPGGFLPFYFRMPANGSGGTLIAGLDLDWLAEHLRSLKRAGSPFLASGVLTVADADGVVLGRDERQAEFVGKPFPSAALPILQARDHGVMRLHSMDGTERIVGYSPPTAANQRLTVTVGLFEPDLTGDIERTLRQSLITAAAVSLFAFALTVLIARRSIAAPTRRLLDTATRWRQGDLSARAEESGQGWEFGRIAAAYNGMAAALQQREEELRRHATEMEERVVERTRDLSLAHERLQREVSERQSTEEALNQAHKVQALGQLAAGIAHDFNNVLQAVAGNVAVIRGRSAEPETVARFAAKAEQAVERGISVTRRLLAFARGESLRQERLALRPLLHGLGEVLRPTLGGRVRLQVAVPDGLPEVLADRGQLETVLVNLATNARDAMPEGGTITLSAAGDPEDGVEGTAPGRFVRLTVADTGAGMDAATLARACEPFFSTKPLGQGTGLGLAMARNFAERSGGRLSIDSHPGRGTTVSLWLPSSTELGANPGDDARRSTPTARAAACVLVVDDEEPVREVLAAQLGLAGYVVRDAGDSAAALAVLDSGERIDVIVSDLAMPGQDGVSLIREARRRRPGLPAVLITGYVGDAALMAIGDKLGGRFALLRKPVTGADLADEVAVLLASAPQPEHTSRRG